MPDWWQAGARWLYKKDVWRKYCSCQIDKINGVFSTGIEWLDTARIPFFSPIDGKVLAQHGFLRRGGVKKLLQASAAFLLHWRMLPSKGQIDVQQIRRSAAAPIKNRWNWSRTKWVTCRLHGVQEMIDICGFCAETPTITDWPCGERPGHRMYEQWHPLGITNYSAFNFQYDMELECTAGLGVQNVVANPETFKQPLCAIACQKISFSKNMA